MDMQHRKHSKHNEYTFGWIFIQEIYLITCLYISIYRVLAPSETQCNHQGGFHDYDIHRFCNVKNRNKIYENKDVTLSLCGDCE